MWHCASRIFFSFLLLFFAHKRINSSFSGRMFCQQDLESHSMCLFIVGKRVCVGGLLWRRRWWW